MRTGQRPKEEGKGGDGGGRSGEEEGFSVVFRGYVEEWERDEEEEDEAEEVGGCHVRTSWQGVVHR